ALPDPRARCPLRTYITRPDVQSIRVGISMKRLHAGNHAELAEARNVCGADVFDVFDSRAAIFGVVLGFSEFVGVESRADGIVADSVSEKLQPALVQRGDGGFVFLRIPEKRASYGRIVRVGFQESGGVG